VTSQRIRAGHTARQVVRSARREQHRLTPLHTCSSYASQSDSLISRSSHAAHSSKILVPARTVPDTVLDACAAVAT
jgi:hypothetical protein